MEQSKYSLQLHEMIGFPIIVFLDVVFRIDSDGYLYLCHTFLLYLTRPKRTNRKQVNAIYAIEQHINPIKLILWISKIKTSYTSSFHMEPLVL